METPETRCFCCKGPFSIVTGSLMGPKKTPFCGTCMNDFMQWMHGHTRRRSGKLRFYDFAGVPPEVSMQQMIDMIPDPVVKVLRRLKQHGFQAYLVGGCVRDMFLGKEPKDYDVATSARPEDVQKSFQRTIPTGIQHGTVTVVSEGEQVEVTTFRSEGAYLDGRRPSSVSFETRIEVDLSRRDFTINAMAFDPIERELVDPFGGQEDIAAKKIRCVGIAEDRFSEDGLRPMRAVRFAATLGFEIDYGTLDAIPRSLGSFRKVSMERINAEVCKILMSTNSTKGVDFLVHTGMLNAFLPELTGCSIPDIGKMPAELCSRLSAMLLPLSETNVDLLSVMQRLKFSTFEADKVSLCLTNMDWLISLNDPPTTDADLRRFLSEVGIPDTFRLITFSEAYYRPCAFLKERFIQLLELNPPLSPRELALNGKDIMRTLGIGPGPRVGQATKFLFEAVLEYPELNTVDGLTNALREWRP